MLRHVNGYKAAKNLMWSSECYRPGMNAIRRKWRQHGRKISITGEEADAYLNLSQYGESLWKDIPWDDLVRTLPIAYAAVKGMLHGADRSLRRAEMSARVARIEENAKRGRTGQAIRFALGAKKSGFDLSSLNIDGETVTDQDVISQSATVHMRRWFEERSDTMSGSLGGAGVVWRDAFAPLDTCGTPGAPMETPAAEGNRRR